MLEVEPGLAQEFATEVAEHIEACEQVLLRAGTEALSSEDINLLFRSVHSVKGLARVISHTGLETLTHQAESLLASVREGKQELGPSAQDLLLKTVDAIGVARSCLVDGVEFQPDSRLLAELEAATGSRAKGKIEPNGLDTHAESPESDLYFDAETLVALAELLAELLPRIVQRIIARVPDEALDEIELDDIAVLRFALNKVGLHGLKQYVGALADPLQPVSLAECLLRANRLSSVLELPCGASEAIAAARPFLLRALREALARNDWEPVAPLLRLLTPMSPFIALIPQLIRPKCPMPNVESCLADIRRAVSAELEPDSASQTDFSISAAGGIRSMLAQPHRLPASVVHFLDARTIDPARFRSLPVAIVERLTALATQGKMELFEAVFDQTGRADATIGFAGAMAKDRELILSECAMVGGRSCLLLLLATTTSIEELNRRMLDTKGELDLAELRKLDAQHPAGYFSVKIKAAAEPVGGVQVRLPVALLDSMFGRLGQFFGVVTRFNAMVTDAEPPDILRDLTDYGVLHAPHLLPKIDRLVRQQREYGVLEAEIHVLISQIHEMTLGLRVIPMDTLFARFPRMVRDTARAQGKLVRFDARSNGIRVDGGMLELLADPLMHMLRNCIDHGIEPPDQREAAGKPRTAVLTLSCEQRGNRILITIGDDGRGIDVRRVMQKAISLNLTTEAKGATLTDEQIARFIFSPGFSTADTITATSGRGVGMDVALVNVTKLGGKIDIMTRRERGTSFTLDIPLSKAIQSTLLADTGVQTVAFPDRMVVEGVLCSSSAIQWVNGQRSILLHERFLPLFKLVDLMKLPSEGEDRCAALQTKQLQTEELSIVVCELDGRRMGIEVKRILRRAELLIQEMHPRVAKLPGVGGISTLGADKIVVVMDPEGLFQLARGHAVFGLRTHVVRIEEGLF